MEMPLQNENGHAVSKMECWACAVKVKKIAFEELQNFKCINEGCTSGN